VWRNFLSSPFSSLSRSIPWGGVGCKEMVSSFFPYLKNVVGFAFIPRAKSLWLKCWLTRSLAAFATQNSVLAFQSCLHGEAHRN
jgi:hypothetical protein